MRSKSLHPSVVRWSGILLISVVLMPISVCVHSPVRNDFRAQLLTLEQMNSNFVGFAERLAPRRDTDAAGMATRKADGGDTRK